VARKTKTITIDDMRITVYEVVVADLLAALDTPEDEAAGRLDEFMPKCTDLSLDKAKTLAPSELKAVWDAFRDVNDVFFSLLEKLGVTDAVTGEVRAAVLAELNATVPTARSGGSSGSAAPTSNPG